jgi:glycine/D-amino acid oxidase-like deaminating enzyme
MKRVAIVGFGIAGSAAARLAPAGCSIMVFDAGIRRCSSRVATGLVNPIVLKRRRAVWRAKEALEAAHRMYPAEFCSTEPIYEVLQTAAEVNDWGALQDHHVLGEFLGELVDAPDYVRGLKLGMVQGSFRLRIAAYLDWASQQFECSTDPVVQICQLDSEAWQINEREEFDAVLLCEGYQARWAEHFWGDLGFARTSGQGLRIQSATESSLMLHRSHFLVPEGEGIHQLGSTYAWGIEHGDLDPPPAEQGQTQELLKSAQSWFGGEIQVLDAWTGIRPTTKDRRPRWGWHPELQGLGLLNGLGSRGTLHAPLLAAELWNSAKF